MCSWARWRSRHPSSSRHELGAVPVARQRHGQGDTPRGVRRSDPVPCQVGPLCPSLRSAGQQPYLNGMAVVVTRSLGGTDYIQDGLISIVVDPHVASMRSALTAVIGASNPHEHEGMCETRALWGSGPTRPPGTRPRCCGHGAPRRPRRFLTGPPSLPCDRTPTSTSWTVGGCVPGQPTCAAPGSRS